VGIEPPLGDLLLKAIDVKLPHPRGEGFPAASDLGLGLGDLLFYVVAKAPARLADLFSGDIGVIVVIAPVGLARLVAVSQRAMPLDIVLHDPRVAVDPPALTRADQLAIVVGLVSRELLHCSPSAMPRFSISTPRALARQ